ncbi:MAG: hypothetical protein AUI63_05045 [Gemmatimonadetes bacterium 13_1_40CM_2_60_3]|nr:MAG: hypothetical protein AUI63_05045 [Gemmatimonadetes bacterium 13_1_40CM_2_60_3]
MRDWPQEGNLAYRAAALYAERTGWPKGFEIEIVKNIPIGGGLGGGSADAAATLRILNTLSPKPISEENLIALAEELGSDREAASITTVAVERHPTFLPAFRDRNRTGL